MTLDLDRLREALEWWNEDAKGKPWYMDPARELWKYRGSRDEWGRITTDAIVILLHVRNRLEPIHDAARFLLGAEKRWMCANTGDTRCMSETDAYNLDRNWPTTAPHADCGWRLSIPWPGEEHESLR